MKKQGNGEEIVDMEPQEPSREAKPGPQEQHKDPRATKGINWSGNNITTILGWVTIGSYTVEALDISIEWCRNIIRNNTIIGMICSTASGSISVANFGTLKNDPNLQTIFNILFTVLTFIVAINTGRIKIFQIQERMEQFIKMRHEWTAFITSIATELQIPIPMRLDAAYIIEENRVKYMNLLRMDCEIPYFAKHKIKVQMRNRKLKNEYHMSLIRNNGLSLSDITFDIATTEGKILEQIQQNPGYHHNKEINSIYDDICAPRVEEVVSRPLEKSNTLNKISRSSLSRFITTDVVQTFKNFVKM